MGDRSCGRNVRAGKNTWFVENRARLVTSLMYMSAVRLSRCAKYDWFCTINTHRETERHRDIETERHRDRDRDRERDRPRVRLYDRGMLFFVLLLRSVFGRQSQTVC